MATKFWNVIPRDIRLFPTIDLSYSIWKSPFYTVYTCKCCHLVEWLPAGASDSGLIVNTLQHANTVIVIAVVIDFVIIIIIL